MPQHDVGLILMRQLASGLAVPTLIADETGDLLFFNEPAEQLLGERFDEIGEMSLERRLRVFSFHDEHGKALAPEESPLAVAMGELRPVHRLVWGRGFDGVERHVEVTAFPLLGAGGHLIGVVAMFWERSGKTHPVQSVDRQ
jgi:PAS domain-containing protein